MMWQTTVKAPLRGGVGGKEVFMEVLYALSSTLKEDNPKFNRDKFITACTKEN